MFAYILNVTTCPRCDRLFLFLRVQEAAHLLQKNKEGDIGAQCGCQRALAGDQVETSGCLDGTLLPPGCVLHADPSCTVIRDHFSVAGMGKHRYD